jgi:hypothetical protein
MVQWKLDQREIEAGNLSEEQATAIKAFHAKDNFREACREMTNLFAFFGAGFFVFGILIGSVTGDADDTIRLVLFGVICLLIAALPVLLYVKALKAYEPEEAGLSRFFGGR